MSDTKLSQEQKNSIEIAQKYQQFNNHLIETYGVYLSPTLTMQQLPATPEMIAAVTPQKEVKAEDPKGDE